MATCLFPAKKKKKRRRKFLFILVSPLILQSCSSGLSKRLSLGYSPLCVRVKSLLSCLTVCDPMDCIAHQAPLSMGFSKQEYWSGLSCPPPGHLPHPGIEPTSLMSPALADGYLPLVPTGKPLVVSKDTKSNLTHSSYIACLLSS